MKKHYCIQSFRAKSVLMRCMKKIPLAMRCTLFMLFCLVGMTFANEGYAQKAMVNIALEDKTVDEVLTELEQGTEFVFFYNNKQIDVKRRVSVQANNKTIFKVLNDVFKGTNVGYKVLDRNIILYDKAIGADSVQSTMQTTTVKGSVVDATGEPVIGASILVKGTTNGVITDVDGNFTLSNVAPDATLVVSYVGYKTQEVRVGGKTSFNIVLAEDAEVLDEVVVVGYGVQKKQSLTGAVTAITSESIQTTKSENLINNIQGKMPGLMIRQKTGEPGTFDNMISIRGGGNPLIVIDGVTREYEEFAQLNSEDIESISILKDASAAIYGMNSANGVIIVTTKQGASEKTRVSYSGLFGMKHATGMEETVDAYTFRVMENEMSRNGKKAEVYSQDVLDKYKNGVEGYQDWDWIDMYMNKLAFATNHTLSVRGGNDKVKYFVSAGYNRDNGLLKSGIQYYERFTFRSNVSAELAKGLTMNVKVAGRWNQTQRPREDFMWTFKTLLVNDRGVGPYAIGSTDHYSDIAPESKNAAALVDPDKDGYRRNRGVNYSADIDLTWKVPFVEGLTVGVVGSFDGNNRNNSELQKSYQLYDYFTNQPTKTYGQDRYQNTMGVFQKLYGRAQVNYMNSFGKHNLNVTGVVEASGSRYDELYGRRLYDGYFSNDILNQADASTATNSGYRNETRLAAYLLRANYDFAGKYLLEVVGRYDGSYRYAPGHRWAFFPSVSAGWRISEEKFMKEKLPFVSNMKLRVSYGKSGYDAGDPFQYVAAYTQGSSGYVLDGTKLTMGMVAPGVVLDNLSWVVTKTANLGLDFDLWNGKLFGTFEIYRRVNDGLLASRLQDIPNTFGASFPKENINSEENRGLEIELGTRGKIGKDFGYTISANYSFTRYKYLKVEHSPYQSSMDRYLNGYENRTIGGMWNHSGGGMWIQKTDGQFQSISEFEKAPLYGGSNGNSMMLPGSFRIVDRNGDGVISYEDQLPESRRAGANPPYQFGLNLGFTYKSFDLNILFQGAAGYVIGYANDDVFGYGSKTNPTLMKKYMNRWHTTNITDDPYNPSTQWVSGKYPALRRDFTGTQDNGNSWGVGAIPFWNPNATYLRLKSLELGYTLPKNLTRKVGISDLRVFVNGFNLLTFCNSLLKDADPEREERDWGASLAYPLMKAYNIGLNINF